jgi:alkylation response protein AidB-like acyl-CoA dehydrogenase
MGFDTVTLTALCTACQVLGGNGYVNDYPTGRILRDAKLYEIGAGVLLMLFEQVQCMDLVQCALLVARLVPVLC